MNTLSKFVTANGSFIDKNDYLYFYKFENLFSSLNNNKNIIFYKPEWKDTKNHLIQIFHHFSNIKEKCLLLMTNGDVDIPCIKQEWFDQDNIPYSEETQKLIESTPIDSFLELDILNLIPSNCKIYCNSVIKKSNNLNMIPLGRDFKGESESNFSFDMNNKTNLCYYNCSIPPKSIHWYGRIREHIYNSVKNKSFVVCENILPNNGRNIETESFINYYNKIASSKFMICPRGCGLDTYRMWDCLYLGCVPIVVKYEGYDDYSDLPILFIDKWQDYANLTEDYLKNKWIEMLEKKYNYDKLKFSWWKNKITSEINS
jgi:hypothetical protein